MELSLFLHPLYLGHDARSCKLVVLESVTIVGCTPAVLQQFIAAPTGFTQPNFIAIGPTGAPLSNSMMAAPPVHPSPAVGTITPQLFALPPPQSGVPRCQPAAGVIPAPGSGVSVSLAPAYSVSMPTNAAGYQPVLYWYPSPPVSPQNTYYMPTCPTTVSAKGLPYTSKISDVLAFFDGIYEVSHFSMLYSTRVSLSS